MELSSLNFGANTRYSDDAFLLHAVAGLCSSHLCSLLQLNSFLYGLHFLHIPDEKVGILMAAAPSAWIWQFGGRLLSWELELTHPSGFDWHEHLRIALANRNKPKCCTCICWHPRIVAGIFSSRWMALIQPATGSGKKRRHHRPAKPSFLSLESLYFRPRSCDEPVD